jgi:spore coat polysaccharide biosynthesis protein SpsF
VTTICVVQARTGSTRLHRKVLADLGGLPMLAFLLRRIAPLREGRVDHLVVATTDDTADDEVAGLARDEGIDVVRGPEDDVLARFALALDVFPADRVVRITADCPLTDRRIVRAALDLHGSWPVDYVSNTLVRTFPDGLDVEVVSASALRAAAAEAVDPVEREHVTPFVYRRPERFALRNLRFARTPDDEDLGKWRWTVDTPRDLAFARRVVTALGHTDFDWIAAKMFGPNRDPDEDPVTLRPAVPGDVTLLRALRNDPESVRWSRNRREVGLEEHVAWFADVLSCPASRVWIALEDGSIVGQARVDVRDGVGTVSVTVAPEARGRGVGAGILRALVRVLAADRQVHTLVAWIDRDNAASLGAFGRVGFAETGADDAGFARYEARTDVLTSSITRST